MKIIATAAIAALSVGILGACAVEASESATPVQPAPVTTSAAPEPEPEPTELPIPCADLEAGDDESVKLYAELDASIGSDLMLTTVQESCPQHLAKYQQIIAPPDKAEFAEIGERDFALLVKDPDAYEGKLYVVYGEVTQFDAATGTTTFRADVTGQLPEKDYSGEYEFWLDGENSIVSGSEGLLGGIVEDDQVKMWVEVDGAFSYDTQIGGSTTVPSFDVHYMDIIGRAS